MLNWLFRLSHRLAAWMFGRALPQQYHRSISTDATARMPWVAAPRRNFLWSKVPKCPAYWVGK
jgi:hypothetical protein